MLDEHSSEDSVDETNEHPSQNNTDEDRSTEQYLARSVDLSSSDLLGIQNKQNQKEDVFAEQPFDSLDELIDDPLGLSSIDDDPLGLSSIDDNPPGLSSIKVPVSSVYSEMSLSDYRVLRESVSAEMDKAQLQAEIDRLSSQQDKETDEDNETNSSPYPFQRKEYGYFNSSVISDAIIKRFKLDRILISTRIKIGFLAIVCFTLVMGVIGIWNLNHLHDVTEDIIASPLHVSNAALKFHRSLSNNELLLETILLEKDAKKILETEAIILKERTSIKTSFLEIKEQSPIKEEELEDINYLLTEIERLQNKVLDLLKKGDSLEAYDLATGDLYSISKKLNQKAKVFETICSTIAADYHNTAEIALNKRRNLLIFMLITTIFLEGLIAFVVSTTTTRPLLQVIEKLNSLAKGDLTGISFDKTGTDEVGLLKQNYNKLREQLLSLVTTVERKSNIINKIAVDISKSSHQRFFNINEHVSVTKDAQKTLESLLENSKEVSSASSMVMNNAQTTNQTTHTIESNLNSLVHNLKEVTKVTNLIKQIALKSEILALNASLEGIHAGKKGASFSLVATEMQQLAETVLKLAKDINTLNITIGNATKQTIFALKQTKQLSNETTQSAEKIVTLAQVQEQDSTETKLAIENLASMTSQYSIEAEELVIISANLTELSKIMSTSISTFILNEKQVLKEDELQFLLDEAYTL